MKLILYLLLTAFFYMSCSGPHNLMSNPGFEQGTREEPEGWPSEVYYSVCIYKFTVN